MSRPPSGDVIEWSDEDRIRKLITEDIPERVSADKALRRVIINLMKDDTELFKQFSDNQDFSRWLKETIFAMTYEETGR